MRSNSIHLLSEKTINQIAAGEVIENPASVVKELVENAVDAGARRIVVAIQGGGFQKIEVSDDGIGMSAQDAELSLVRHATSKIRDADDLLCLATMGFRGEALASIAAISKLKLTTAQEGGVGTQIEVDGGKIVGISPIGRAQGTTLSITSLFFNVPARKKFQKSSAASSAEITKAMTQLALAHPFVGFELIQQDRALFSCPAVTGGDLLEALKERACIVLGAEFASSLLPLDCKEEQCHIRGWIAGPEMTRHNRTGQYLFVNQRPVQCLPLAYALRDAYGTRLSTDRHPIYLLHMEIAPDRVDVNVHPQKKEIRLREEGLLRYAIHGAVNEALGTNVRREDPVFHNLPPVFFSEPLLLRETPRTESFAPLLFEYLLEPIGLFENYLLLDARSAPTPLLPSPGDGILWIDLSGADARIRFEQLMRNAQATPASQGLLLPLTYSPSKAEAQLLASRVATLGALGIHMRSIGETTFLIEAIPPFLEEKEVIALIEELLDEKVHLELFAARAARRGNPPTDLGSGLALVKELLKTECPTRCPLGKAITFHMRKDAIQKPFCS
ncbi:MAG: DNA mismatch repair endonuclease MutL [Verrucomicrobia bacterium]|nr:DNA mismatch repair endonuclease MutL [Verrucomicrobiota bacterium]